MYLNLTQDAIFSLNFKGIQNMEAGKEISTYKIKKYGK